MVRRTYKLENLTVLKGENNKENKKSPARLDKRETQKRVAEKGEEKEGEVRDKCGDGGRGRRGFGIEVMSSGDVETARRSKKIWRAR